MKFGWCISLVILALILPLVPAVEYLTVKEIEEKQRKNAVMISIFSTLMFVMLLFVGSIINSTCALISETFGDVEQLQRKIKELNAEIDGYQKQVANLESEIKEAKQTVDINLREYEKQLADEEKRINEKIKQVLNERAGLEQQQQVRRAQRNQLIVKTVRPNAPGQNNPT